MKISLKKQISTKKIFKIIKSYDVVLLFTVFYLPQFYQEMAKKKAFALRQKPQCNALSVNIKHKFTQYNFLQNPPCLPYSKEKLLPFFLHLHNKSAQHLDIFSGLPLSGQTVLFATQDQEQAQLVLTSATSYKGIFLGGFYKNVYKDNAEYKALCNAMVYKDRVYSKFCRAMCFTLFKNFRITGKVKNLSILLLKNYQQKNPGSLSFFKPLSL